MSLPNIDTWIHGDHDIMPDADQTKRQREAAIDAAIKQDPTIGPAEATLIRRLLKGRTRSIDRERTDQIRRDIEVEKNHTEDPDNGEAPT